MGQLGQQQAAVGEELFQVGIGEGHHLGQVGIQAHEAGQGVAETGELALPVISNISSHSSHRSFCSLRLDFGFLPRQVMQWSGHSTLSALQRYMGHNESYPDITD
ncbi:MAG: hypothetical protein EOO61_03595 [Hymenobacter sp.]|nr:MAG: hypothetical protein EOO61_03595 [Hymenobacter sp.]